MFLVYCPGNRSIYSVPIEEAPVGGMSLRVDPPGNGQSDGIRWAHDYLLPG